MLTKLWRATVVFGFVLNACSLPTEALQPEPLRAKQFSPLVGPGVSLTLVPLVTGHRQIPRCFATGAMPCYEFVDLVHVAYLVRHPKATFLIDAAWSSHAREDLAAMPAINRAALDYQSTGSLGEKLRVLGNPHIDFVLLTHIHVDHTSGLTDMAHPVVLLDAMEANYLGAATGGTNPAVVPRHFADATIRQFAFDGPPVENFPASRDLFSDGSVVLVPLPGHTPGSMGIFLNNVNGRRLFFIGDTAWTLDGVRLPGLRPISTSRNVDFDIISLGDSLQRIHELSLAYPNLLIVPAHDGDVLKKVRELVAPAR